MRRARGVGPFLETTGIVHPEEHVRPTPRRLLVIDADEVDRSATRDALVAAGFLVDVEADGLRGLERVLEDACDLVLLDPHAQQVDGFEILGDLARLRPGLPILLTLAGASVDAAVRAVRLGAVDVLPKPFTADALHERVEAALASAPASQSARPCPEMPAGCRLIGDSDAMAQVHVLIARVAPTGATVVITGESGTGKELAALEIHAASLRRNRPLVSLDCSTLSPGLLESELFGHVKGSFTGAVATKPGLFEVADRGTLFLDEVSSLSLETQGKLLRVLETGEIKPVGGVATRRVDIRLIAASNRELAELVKEQAFREDLYYRLNVVPLRMPALREHPEDIPQLLHWFLMHRRHPGDRGPHRLSPDAIDRLMRYAWPGNVRELRNLAERLVVTVEGDEVTAAHLPPEIDGTGQGAVGRVPHTSQQLRALKRELHDRATEQVERAFVLAALRRNGWNVTHAARDTGILRPNFHALMRKYGIRSEHS